LERDLGDLAQRERPEVQLLAREVHRYRERAHTSREGLGDDELRLREKQERLDGLRRSEESRVHKNMMIRRDKLERRLIGWKKLLRDSRETMQALEAASAENHRKRQGLAANLEKHQWTAPARRRSSGISKPIRRSSAP